MPCYASHGCEGKRDILLVMQSGNTQVRQVSHLSPPELRLTLHARQGRSEEHVILRSRLSIRMLPSFLYSYMSFMSEEYDEGCYSNQGIYL